MTTKLYVTVAKTAHTNAQWTFEIPLKPDTMIRRRSKKRAAQEREYSKLRKDFLESNPLCAVHSKINPDLNGPCYLNPCFASEVHHMKGRVGALLTDTRYFLPVCPAAHREIEERPLWAKERGYSLSRHQTETI